LADNHINILIILFAYFVEAAQVLGLVVCASLIYRLVIGPMDFLLGQLVLTLGWSAVDTMCLLGCAISIIKMLFVSYFDLVFSQGP
jgi:hypothetical protein